MKKLLLLTLAGALLSTATPAFADFIAVNSNITTSTRWTRNNVYILTRVIFVTPGVTLTIEPGTVIRGIKAGAAGSDIAAEPGSLVVARGAKMVANGTPDDPIVITSIDDPHVIGGAATIPASYVNSQGITKTVTPQNYAPDGPTGENGFAYNQQLGGLVMLGNAYVANYNAGTGTPPTIDANGDGLPDEPHTIQNPSNNNVGGYGRDIIEGLDPITIPSAEFLGAYGNKDDNDNSGVYRFVSMRYGGFKIGPNNEINAITTGGLGRGTIIEFCEAAFNVDDGFEFFGGVHDTRHLFSLYIMDDSFDADEGFRGTHQFWAAVQGNTTVPRSGYPQNNTLTGVTFTDTQFDKLFEVDGAEDDNNAALPYTRFDVFNLTMLAGGTTNNSVRFRLDARVELHNVVGGNMARVASDVPQLDIALDPIGTIGDVYNFHYHFDGNLGTDERRNFTDNVAPFTTTAVEETTPQFRGSGFYTKNGLDLRLAPGSAALIEDGTTPAGRNLVQANYAGYMRDNTFLSGWSVAEYLQVLPETNIARPAVSISGTTNPVVSFASAGAGVKYVVEKSTDRRTWTPVNNGNTVSGSGTVSFTDTSTTLTAGVPTFYRVYAL
jgi:hypothetical protein